MENQVYTLEVSVHYFVCMCLIVCVFNSIVKSQINDLIAKSHNLITYLSCHYIWNNDKKSEPCSAPIQHFGSCSQNLPGKKVAKYHLKECSDVSTTMIVFTSLPSVMSLYALLVF